jgi:hypothetical protein
LFNKAAKRSLLVRRPAGGEMVFVKIHLLSLDFWFFGVEIFSGRKSSVTVLVGVIVVFLGYFAA